MSLNWALCLSLIIVEKLSTLLKKRLFMLKLLNI